jgi:HAD superfamily hydrolase (TIGR01509 family)
VKKLVIFDCDGTLVDSEIIASRVFPAVWSEMGVSMSSDFFLCNFVGVGSDAPIIKETKLRLPPNAMEIADQKFDDELRKSLKPVRGMHELLSSLEHQTCVASNSSLGYVREALSITKLDTFFGERVYSAHQVKRPKPEPDLFLHAANELGYSPAQCLVIEDSVSGIIAAQRAGMTAIGFMGGLHFNTVVKNRLLEARADHYCSDISELRELVSRSFH